MSEAKWRQESDGSWRIEPTGSTFLKVSRQPDGWVRVSTVYGFGADLTAEQWETLPLRSTGPVEAVERLRSEADAYRRERDVAQKALADRLVGPTPPPEPDRLAALEARVVALEAKAAPSFSLSDCRDCGAFRGHDHVCKVDPKPIADEVERALAFATGACRHLVRGHVSDAGACLDQLEPALEALAKRLRGES